MLSPRTGLGGSASSRKLRPRPQPRCNSTGLGLGLVYVMASASWPRCSLDNVTNRVLHYDTSAVDTSFEMVFAGGQYTVLSSLFERVFCVPASSAPVEKVFSQSGLIMRPNRARMSDTVLESSS